MHAQWVAVRTYSYVPPRLSGEIQLPQLRVALDCLFVLGKGSCSTNQCQSQTRDARVSPAAAVFTLKKPFRKMERFIALSPVLMVTPEKSNVAQVVIAAD